MFLPNKTIKNKKFNYLQKKMYVRKTQYGGDVVMFLPNKIIKNNKMNYPQKNVGLAHGFKTMCTWYVHSFKTMCKTF